MVGHQQEGEEASWGDDADCNVCRVSEEGPVEGTDGGKTKAVPWKTQWV